jgi:hypothetical protein
LARFVETRALDGDVCAREIVDGIQKNCARTSITRSTVFFYLMKRLMPSPTDAMVARMMRRGIPYL